MGTWEPATTTTAAVSVTPNSGGGVGPQLFDAVYSDTGGTSDLQVVYFSIGSTFLATNSCNVYYEPGNDSLFLLSDDNSTSATLGEGGGGSVSNSQCTLSGGSTAASSSGGQPDGSIYYHVQGWVHRVEDGVRLIADLRWDAEWGDHSGHLDTLI